MAEIRIAHSPKTETTNITLYPPSGQPIPLQVTECSYERGVLKYTDSGGMMCETTLRWMTEKRRRAPGDLS